MRIIELIAILIISATIQGSSGAPPFSVALRPPVGPIKAGDQVVLTAVTTNTSDHEVRFARSFAPREEVSDYDIDIKDSEGQTPPLTEAYSRLREHPTARWGSYSTYALLPGKSFEEELIVTKLYDLNRPGKYTVSVLRGQRPTWQTQGKAAVRSNTITITVAK
jgi:hypothetical protein